MAGDRKGRPYRVRRDNAGRLWEPPLHDYPSCPAKAERSLIALLVLSKPHPLTLGCGLGLRRAGAY